ncbi:MAG: FMN-binding protein [Cellulosilyticaceae bacterium]
MKRILILAMISILSLTALLSGCTKKEEAKKDQMDAKLGNVSEAQGTKDENGWIPQLRLTFEADKIIEVYFDYLNEKSEKKSEAGDYNKNMKEKTGVSAKEAMEQLRQDLINKQNPDEISTITGATQTSEQFKALSKEAYDKHKNGTNK